MTPFLLLVAWVLLLVVVAWWMNRRTRLGHVRDRLAEEHRAAFEPELEPIPDEGMGWLRRWLYLAGFRSPEAPTTFLVTATAAVGLGFLVAFGAERSSFMADALYWLDDLPGGIGALLAPILFVGPWVAGLGVALVPWLRVRRARRRRVREVEEDLPLTLQILATLARAGLGFDAALVRVLESSPADRTLRQELHDFRIELLSGIPRVQAWRRLSRRVEVPSLSIFVSAMVHAEQIGGGLALVLEHQADDVQGRRRERALVRAQSLPVKLVFPMVICFLPGIFAWTMGPAFYQFLQVIEGVMRGGEPPL